MSYLGIGPHESFVKRVRWCADSQFSSSLFHFQDLGNESLNFVCCLAHRMDEQEELYHIDAFRVFRG